MVNHKIDMNRYEWELNNLKAKPKKDNAVCFYGSSTFAIWKTLEEEFKDYNAINLGFGGSTVDEAVYHFDDILAPFNPKVLVFYDGDNDPVCDYTVDETTELYEKLFDMARNTFKGIKIIILETKVSKARIEYKDYVIALNKWIEEYSSKHSDTSCVRTSDICFDKDGNFIKEHYLDDELHFSPKAYVIIKERIVKLLNE